MLWNAKTFNHIFFKFKFLNTNVSLKIFVFTDKITNIQVIKNILSYSNLTEKYEKIIFLHKLNQYDEYENRKKNTEIEFILYINILLNTVWVNKHENNNSKNKTIFTHIFPQIRLKRNYGND